MFILTREVSSRISFAPKKIFLVLNSLAKWAFFFSVLNDLASCEGNKWDKIRNLRRNHRNKDISKHVYANARIIGSRWERCRHAVGGACKGQLDAVCQGDRGLVLKHPLILLTEFCLIHIDTFHWAKESNKIPRWIPFYVCPQSVEGQAAGKRRTQWQVGYEKYLSPTLSHWGENKDFCLSPNDHIWLVLHMTWEDSSGRV